MTGCTCVRFLARTGALGNGVFGQRALRARVGLPGGEAPWHRAGQQRGLLDNPVISFSVDRAGRRGTGPGRRGSHPECGSACGLPGKLES